MGVEPALKIAVALARRTSRAFGPTVHPAPASTAYRRLPAGVTSAGLGCVGATHGHCPAPAYARGAALSVLDGLSIGADSYFFSRRDQIVALAARYAMPTIYPYREEATAGGLMSYGTDLSDAYRREGNYVGRILKGAEPQDLPVQQSVKVELILNLKTAKTLGINLSLALLGRADEVIE